MSLNLLPFGFVPLMLVAMFSAQMSTMDTALNANAALFVTNAYPALMRRLGREPCKDHRFLLGMGRIFTVLLGAALIGAALFFSAKLNDKGIFELTFRINAILGIPLLMPLFLGFYIRKTPLWSGWFCFGVALICSVVCSALKMPSFRLALINSGAGLLAFLLTTLFWERTPKSAQSQLSEFFTRIHTPVNFREEVGGENDSQQLRLVGALSLCLGGFISLFMFAGYPLEASSRNGAYLCG
jgi:Na+/proline symporter